MKVPLSWLRDYVDLPESIGSLCERLTSAGLEVAGVRVIGLPWPEGLHAKAEEVGPVWDRDKIVVGRVLSVERHPNADRLTLATVDYGAAQPKTVVTGAPNIKPGESGQSVIVALSGSVLYDGHADTRVLRELKPSKIRGVPSDAMVCSAYELGISEEHEGIILLDEDLAPGTPLVEVMGDIVIELDVLPNMARCLSMIGVAREVAALTGQTFRLPDHKVPATAEPVAGKVEIAIEDPKLCARYAAGLLRGAKVGKAPGWMQRRLSNAGMRPISNLVDVTNYVMLEWGQPLHAFDYDVLVQRARGKKPVITVRPARKGEKIKTLDGVDRELSTDNLIIADGAGPVAIAGVMGGAETEVSERTENILLESANFDFVSVRGTMKALNLPSEASVRFSKGIHPELVQPAAERALKLMHDHAGATVAKGIVDNYPRPLPPMVIELKASEIKRLLGFDLPLAEATRILTGLEFKVESAGAETLRVTVPPHRVDIQVGSADLIEELARIHGYDRLPATLLADQLPEPRGNRPLEFEERVRDILVGAGLQEVITYALTEPSREKLLGLPELPYVELKNPISSERTVMRHSVLTSVLEVAAGNLRHTENVRLFEIGRVYLPRLGEKLPDEPRRLALFLTGRREAEFWAEAGAAAQPLDFFDLKGIVESLFGELHVDEVAFHSCRAPHLHPGRAADVLVRGVAIGGFGQMHPKVAEAFGLGNRTILVGELDLESIMAAVPERYAYRPIPRFPAALRDVAVIVDEQVPADRIAAEIRAAGGELLADLRLFDVYRGESIPAGTKSLAYALTYQAEDRTLTDKEVDRAHKKITDRLKHVLKAQVRGQEEAVS
ncbi:MAG TPA: phenylalanine--tRNA ligase subunit beta [Gemmataceae bacterium]|nr:phenylalanine--tRNA ligase subunit beta [Gemmataceae bacterium]